MKLKDMVHTSPKKINRLMESRFGFAINFDKLTVEKAERISETISENLDRIRHSVGLHTAERNPRYMELLTVQEGLRVWLNQNRQPLTEGEVGNAEVLLAAKDMVDSVQDIIEKVGKMQNEQLPQLLDSIRDQISPEQAESFKNAVGTTLQTLMDNLQTARQGVDSGVAVLTGDQPQPMDMGAMPEPGAEMPATDFDQDEEEGDGFAATDAATGGAEELGREPR